MNTNTQHITTQDQAVQYAMEWQEHQNNNPVTYGDLATFQAILEQLASKFNLTEEFKENGII